MPGINGMSCCGINEIEDIDNNRDNPTETIKEMGNWIYNHDRNCAFFIFSDIMDKKAGRNLSNYIKKNKLGTISKSAARINPNSGNSLTIWIWAIDKRNMKNHYRKLIEN